MVVVKIYLSAIVLLSDHYLPALPKDVTLDGELFGGRGEFQSTISVVKTINSPHWKGISFQVSAPSTAVHVFSIIAALACCYRIQVFDVPSKADLPFEERLSYLEATFGENGTHASKHVVVVAHDEAKDREHVLEKLKEIEGLGGEGLMLRKPRSPYEGRRSNTLLKIKVSSSFSSTTREPFRCPSTLLNCSY